MHIAKLVALTENAFIPTKGTNGSAGHDLYSAYDYTVPPGDRKLILTDVAIEPPSGYYIRIAACSSLAIFKKIDVTSSIIDPDYQGNISVVLINNGCEEFHIKKGDRVAQFVMEKYCADIQFILVQRFDGKNKVNSETYRETDNDVKTEDIIDDFIIFREQKNVTFNDEIKEFDFI